MNKILSLVNSQFMGYFRTNIVIQMYLRKENNQDTIQDINIENDFNEKHLLKSF
jgi:hypothetical protein